MMKINRIVGIVKNRMPMVKVTFSDGVERIMLISSLATLLGIQVNDPIYPVKTIKKLASDKASYQ